MRIIFLGIGLILAYSGCAQNNCRLTIVQIFPYKDSSLSLNYSKIDKIEYFIIKGYRDSDDCDAQVDIYVKSAKNTLWDKFKSYQMVFYKESNNTNESSIRNNPKVLDRYSQDNDWVFLFTWNYGRFAKKFKIKNGEIISPKSEIKVGDIIKD
ncbi:MAG: hypothetical protein U0T68_00730 [Ferruginibacter sp.]